MILRLFPAAVLLSSVPAQASLIALSGAASVSIHGDLTVDGRYNTGIPPQSYDHMQDATAPFSSFNGAVSDSASVTLSEPVPGLVPPYPMTWGLSSEASQTTSVATNGISISGNLSASIGANPQIGALNASAQSTFDLIFRIDDLMAYTLAIDVTAFHGHGFDWMVSPPTFSLISLGAGSPVAINALPRTGTWTWGYDGNGLLAPGDYRLTYNLGTLASSDPLGDFDTKNFSLGLNVTSVPETGTTFFFLAISLALLPALRRWRRLG